MLSMQSLAGYLGGFVGSVALGYIAQHASVNQAWGVAGLLTTASLLLYLAVDRRKKGKASTHEPETTVLETG